MHRPAAALDFARDFSGLGGADITVNTTAADGSGNQYIAGSFTGTTVPLGGVSLTRLGVQDAFVAKLDSGGNVLWAKSFGGTDARAQIGSIAVNGAGEVYLAGKFYSADLSTPALPMIGDYDLFALRLNPATGATVWARNFGGFGASADGGLIAADGTGNAYLAGSFSSASLTTPALAGIGDQDAFVVRLDAASGDPGWAKNFGGLGAHAQAQAIALDGSGHVFVSGNFDSANLSTPALNVIGALDAFALRLDPATGDTVWAKNFGGTGSVFAFGLSIAADNSGNAFLAGGFWGGGLTTPTLAMIGDSDAYVIALNAANGTTNWASNYGGAGASTQGQSITVDGAGSAYLSGYFLGADMTTPALSVTGTIDAFALRLDATDGSATWARGIGGAGASAFAQSIAADGSGNIYLGGYFQSANLSTPALARTGNQDAFALKLNAATGATGGAHSFWSLRPGGNVTVAATAVDNAGHEYVAGYFDSAVLPIGAGILGRIGSRDAFVAKFDAAGNALWAVNFGGTGGASVQSQSIALDGSGGLYLAGFFWDADLTAPALTKIGNNDAFALRLDALTGAAGWAVNFGGAGATAQARAIAADGSGSLYLGGYFQGGSLATPALAAIGQIDAFAIKLNAVTGAAGWSHNYGGPGANMYGQSLAADAAGNVYLGGSFDAANLTVPALAKTGASDAFAIQIDAGTGATNWSKNFGGAAASTQGKSIAPDGAGSVYLAGYFQGGNLSTPVLNKIGNSDAFALKLSAGSGSTTWSKNFSGAAPASAYGQWIVPDGAGKVYLGGTFSGGNLSTPALNKIGTTDTFAIALDAANGTAGWARNFGGAGAWMDNQALAVDNLNNLYLAGSFWSSDLSTPALTKLGSADGFLVKLATILYGVTYDANGGAGSVPVDANSYAQGDPVTVLAGSGLSRTGYTRGGWNTQSGGGGTSYPGDGSGTFNIGAGNVTLFAQWTINSYTVTFNSNGGSDVVAQSVNYNLTATQPADPGKAGYAFAGWYADIGLTAPFNFSTPITASLTLYAKWAGTTSVQSSVNPSVFGQAVSLSATVTGAAPTGSVTFYDGASVLCLSVALSNGQASCPSSGLGVDSHSITAAYGGDGGNPPTTSPVLTQTVNKADTATAITTHTPNPSVVGAPIAVTATVSVTAPGAGTPSGTVTVGDGSVICVITLPATSCNLTPGSSGAKTLTAAYGGNASFNFSNAPSIGHTVNPPNGATSLTSSANPAAVGTPITLTASVFGNSPGGTVNFRDGASSISGCAAQPPSGGRATCVTSALGLGSHSITAVYSGDGSNPGATSNTLTQRILTSAQLRAKPWLMLLLD